jgi:hypothetical protein
MNFTLEKQSAEATVTEMFENYINIKLVLSAKVPGKHFQNLTISHELKNFLKAHWNEITQLDVTICKLISVLINK